MCFGGRFVERGRGCGWKQTVAYTFGLVCIRELARGGFGIRRKTKNEATILTRNEKVHSREQKLAHEQRETSTDHKNDNLVFLLCKFS